MDRAPGTQRALFDEPPRALKAAAPRPEHGALAARLPPTIRFGTMSWNFPGWMGKVYDAGAPKTRLADRGLPAYASHPLHRAVEVDSDLLRGAGRRLFSDAGGPGAGRFSVSGQGARGVHRLPVPAPRPLRQAARRAERAIPRRRLHQRRRGGSHRGGAGRKAGPLLFQFPPQPLDAPGAFADRLHDFLRRLPRGPTYAVELRNAELFTPAYAAALLDAGAVHCHNVWSAMPPLLQQARAIPPGARRPLVVRWLCAPVTTTRRPRSAFSRSIAFGRRIRRAARPSPGWSPGPTRMGSRPSSRSTTPPKAARRTGSPSWPRSSRLASPDWLSARTMGAPATLRAPPRRRAHRRTGGSGGCKGNEGSAAASRRKRRRIRSGARERRRPGRERGRPW